MLCFKFRKNAYCIKFVINDDNEGPSTSPAVFAIISPMKNANFYLEMARMAVNYYEINPVRMKSFLKSIYRHQYATLMSKMLHDALFIRMTSLQKSSSSMNAVPTAMSEY